MTPAEERQLREFRDRLLASLAKLHLDVDALVKLLSHQPPQTDPSTIAEGETARNEPEPQHPLHFATVRVETQFPKELIEKYDSSQTQGYRLQRWGFRLQIGLLIATVLAFIAAFAYARIAYKQWRAMGSALRESQRQTAVSINSSRLEQRAWIQTTIRLPDAMRSGTPFSIPVKIENTGKTPAKNVFGYVVVNFFPATEAPRLEVPENWQLFKYGMLAAGRGDETKYDLLSTKPVKDASHIAHIPTRDDVMAFAGRKTRLVTYGKLCYDDAFGVHHWLTFCQYTPIGEREDQPLIHCVNYNAADSYEEYPDDSKPCPIVFAGTPQKR